MRRKQLKPSPPDPRREALRQGLLVTATLLQRRRAGEVAEQDIEDYVALNWLEWQGGSLKLTTTGENLCKQLKPRPTEV